MHKQEAGRAAIGVTTGVTATDTTIQTTEDPSGMRYHLESEGGTAVLANNCYRYKHTNHGESLTNAHDLESE